MVLMSDVNPVGDEHPGLSAARIDALVWVPIYLGMFLLALGVSLQRHAAALGSVVVSVGIAAVAIGILLLWLRSRMTERANRVPHTATTKKTNR